MQLQYYHYQKLLERERGFLNAGIQNSTKINDVFDDEMPHLYFLVQL